jgi:hypothetical protein
MPGLLPLFQEERDDDGRETIITGLTTHLRQLNQPGLASIKKPRSGRGFSLTHMHRFGIGSWEKPYPRETFHHIFMDCHSA